MNPGTITSAYRSIFKYVKAAIGHLVLTSSPKLQIAKGYYCSSELG
jgi:hypothetical protein